MFPFIVFIQTPDPLNVTVGAEAEFFCRAEGDIIFFIVNNISDSNLNDPNITPDFGLMIDGILTRILRIVAGVEHNNSVIQCLSITTIGLTATVQQSDPALLMVQGKQHYLASMIHITKQGRRMLSVPRILLWVEYVFSTTTE